MRKPMLMCAWVCVMAFFVVAASPAQATGSNYFSYVSNTGNDSNACDTPATACADFQAALAKTEPFGEIDCVNTGFYTVTYTITQSVTIDCAGAVGLSSIITVNGTGIVVRLRNLSLNGFGGNNFGIDAQNMAALYIENCVIANQSGSTPFLGIKFEPSANAQLFVSNSVISNNGSSSGGTNISGGIYIVPGNGVTAQVSIDKSQINGNFMASPPTAGPAASSEARSATASCPAVPRTASPQSAQARASC